MLSLLWCARPGLNGNKVVALRIVPVVLAFLLLAAHFLRDGNMALVPVCLLIPFLLFIKRRWAHVTVRILTFLGAAIWLQTTIVLVQHRWVTGAPWLRMLLILSGVAAFTLFAAYLLGSETVRKNYR